MPFQFLLVSPVLAPVWIAGLIVPFRRLSLRFVRFLPLTYAVLAVVYLVGNGKAYYLASLYPALLGLGSLPVADWTMRSRRARLRTAVLGTAIVVSAGIGALIALPLLPTTALPGSVIMAINPDQGETVGWPTFIGAVSAAWHAIPDAARTNTVIFTQNYGEAGAIDILGRSDGLPQAYSGHNGFSEWGQAARAATQVVLVGYDGPADARPYFGGCVTLATVDNGVGLDNQEQGLPIQLCRITASRAALWARLTHYD